MSKLNPNLAPRGAKCLINFYGKQKEAMFYGLGGSEGTEESYCFVLARKSKRPDGTSSKYFFTRNESDLIEIL